MRKSVLHFASRCVSNRTGRKLQAGWQGQGNILLCKRSRPPLAPTKSPVYWITCTVSRGLNVPQHENSHSPPSVSQVKKEWSPQLYILGVQFSKVATYRKYAVAYNAEPIPVAARPKAWVCGRALAGIVGSNPTGGMDVYLL
jgi:hypothetical protein